MLLCERESAPPASAQAICLTDVVGRLSAGAASRRIPAKRLVVMNAREIRSAFRPFFAYRGHLNSGMVQFKDVSRP